MADTPKQKRIAILGGGISGMTCAIKLRQNFPDMKFDLYEQNPDFGGTWIANTYPGCACDIQSHLYSFSFELNPNWTTFYPEQKEILAYMHQVARKHDLYKYAKFNTEAINAIWHEERGEWETTFRDKITGETETHFYDYVISCIGGLRIPNIPDVFNDYTGTKIHSSCWDHSVDLTGKKVAVIGSGASAIQIIPAIAEQVSELHSYQRKPAWVAQKLDYNIGPTIHKFFEMFPFILWIWRCLIFLCNESLHFFLRADHSLIKIGEYLAKRDIKRLVKDKETAEKLIPNYRMGCKRVTFHNNYYQNFNRPNVHLHRELITKAEGNTITTDDGHTEEFDVLILATGFNIHEGFKPLTVIGDKNLNIFKYWQDNDAPAYYGTTCTQLPNIVMMLGPNTANGSNSAIFGIECQANYAMQMFKYCIDNNVKIFQLKQSVQDNYFDWIHKEMKKYVWGAYSCGSWYQSRVSDRIGAIWPRTMISYWNRLRNVNFDDYDFILYTKNTKSPKEKEL